MHNLFDFSKLKQHIIKMYGRQINRLYEQLLIKFFHLYPLYIYGSKKYPIYTLQKEHNSLEKIQKMFNKILNKNHKKLKSLLMQLVYNAIQ